MASLLLRIALGIMFLAHGLTKLLVLTPSGTAQYFESIGFPGFVGYLTIAFEIAGGALLLLGILTRIISSLTVIQMIVISFIHSTNGWSFSNTGGGWEYPAFMALSAFSLALLGTGKISVLPQRFHLLTK
ncbi:DoxX family protein [Gilliamella sp. Occ4-3]|uniref:DoxX family protein n=1 Tax=Gilliamella sp. Occ4-3 TaxID=3120254 RepID=UPI00211CEF8E|nr:DoxX family protein [Gilliamella apicola]